MIPDLERSDFLFNVNREEEGCGRRWLGWKMGGEGEKEVKKGSFRLCLCRQLLLQVDLVNLTLLQIHSGADAAYFSSPLSNCNPIASVGDLMSFFAGLGGSAVF